MNKLILLLIILFCSCRKDISLIYGPAQSSSAVLPFLKSADFGSKKFRGFNLSTVHTLAELKAKNIPAARATGANIGRIWITVSHRADNTYYFSDRFGNDLGSQPLATIDSAVKIAQQVGMYLVLTLKVRPDQSSCDLWGTSRKDSITKLWKQLATRYKDKTIIAAYDLINEPRAPGNAVDAYTPEYVSWTIDMIKAIRSVDSSHVIAVEVLGNSMLGNFLQMSRMFNLYSNLIASPHGYSYIALTHQGSGQTVRKTYPGSYPANYFASNSYYKVMLDFKKQYPSVPIWIGEFSCINWSPKNKYGEWTSTRWIDDMITFFEANNISWCYHAWREWQGWDPEIPSSYYTQFSYSNAAPVMTGVSGSAWGSQRTSTAPTITMLSNKWFVKNAQ
jgi:endoglucanase